MVEPISRNCDAGASLALTNALATTGVISIKGFAAAAIIIPNGAFLSGTPTTITWYGCDSIDGDFVIVTDSAGVDLSATAIQEERATPIPKDCVPFAYLKAVLDSGTASVRLTRKS